LCIWVYATIVSTMQATELRIFRLLEGYLYIAGEAFVAKLITNRIEVQVEPGH